MSFDSSEIETYEIATSTPLNSQVVVFSYESQNVCKIQETIEEEIDRLLNCEESINTIGEPELKRNDSNSKHVLSTSKSTILIDCSNTQDASEFIASFRLDSSKINDDDQILLNFIENYEKKNFDKPH